MATDLDTPIEQDFADYEGEALQFGANAEYPIKRKSQMPPPVDIKSSVTVR